MNLKSQSKSFLLQEAHTKRILLAIIINNDSSNNNNIPEGCLVNCFYRDDTFNVSENANERWCSRGNRKLLTKYPTSKVGNAKLVSHMRIWEKRMVRIYIYIALSVPMYEFLKHVVVTTDLFWLKITWTDLYNIGILLGEII